MTEVIVAPKERQQHNPDTHLSDDLYYEASPELFVQVRSIIQCCRLRGSPNSISN